MRSDLELKQKAAKLRAGATRHSFVATPELLLGLEFFRQAILVDSTFASAYAGLSRMYTG